MTRAVAFRLARRASLIGLGAALLKTPLALLSPRAPLSIFEDPTLLKGLIGCGCGLVVLQALIDVSTAIVFCLARPAELPWQPAPLAFGGALSCFLAELFKSLGASAIELVRTFVVVSRAAPNALGRDLFVAIEVIGGCVVALLALLAGIVIGGLTGGFLGLVRRDRAPATDPDGHARSAPGS